MRAREGETERRTHLDVSLQRNAEVAELGARERLDRAVDKDELRPLVYIARQLVDIEEVLRHLFRERRKKPSARHLARPGRAGREDAATGARVSAELVVARCEREGGSKTQKNR